MLTTILGLLFLGDAGSLVDDKGNLSNIYKKKITIILKRRNLTGFVYINIRKWPDQSTNLESKQRLKRRSQTGYHTDFEEIVVSIKLIEFLFKDDWQGTDHSLARGGHEHST
jgi:hypothetical protein